MSAESKFLQGLAVHSMIPGKFRAQPKPIAKPSGTCQDCGRKHRLRRDGTVIQHRRSRDSLNNCGGSGLLPMSVKVRCLFCGTDVFSNILDSTDKANWLVEIQPHYNTPRSKCSGGNLVLKYIVAKNKLTG